MILDRIESGVAVLTDGVGKAFTCPAPLLGNSPREADAFEVTVAGGKIGTLVDGSEPPPVFG